MSRTLIAPRLYSRAMTSQAQKGRGFSLIEVLVAVLIVAVGVLGVAGLQLTTMRFNSGAMLRTSANQLAYNIIDRMRANLNDDFADDYELAMGDEPPAQPDCEGASCTPAQMAAYDLAQWHSQVSDLPSGDGSVEIQAGNIVEVTIEWDDDRDATDDPVQMVVRTQLRELGG